MENIDNIAEVQSAFERREQLAVAGTIGRRVREWADVEGTSHRRVTFVPKVSLIDALSEAELNSIYDE